MQLKEAELAEATDASNTAQRAMSAIKKKETIVHGELEAQRARIKSFQEELEADKASQQLEDKAGQLDNPVESHMAARVSQDEMGLQVAKQKLHVAGE